MACTLLVKLLWEPTVQQNFCGADNNTESQNIPWMYKLGPICVSGELGLERSAIRKDKSKEDDSDGSQLMFSPSLKYAASPPFTSKYE
jgi:hypothetical protein